MLYNLKLRPASVVSVSNNVLISSETCLSIVPDTCHPISCDILKEASLKEALANKSLAIGHLLRAGAAAERYHPGAAASGWGIQGT